MHRLVPWLNRELHYLLNENAGHISYVIARILELLPQYHINSSEFRNVMQRYFGERTVHFLHELYCFASTPYDMTGYDRNVQYTTDNRVSNMINEVLSSSESEASVDSDIMVVSSSEPAAGSSRPRLPPAPGPGVPPPSLAVPAPAPAYPRHYIHEPAPAAPTVAPTAAHVVPIETISHSDTDDDSSEVMVVGYIKPPQDRTPEVVDLLGSDSDVIVQDAEPDDAPPPAPAPLVKLTLRQHAPRSPASASDSDSDSAYTPSPPAPAMHATPAHAAARKRRRSPSPSTSPSSSSSSSSYDASTDSDTDSTAYRSRTRRKRRTQLHAEKTKRKQAAPPKRKQRKTKKSSKDRRRKCNSDKTSRPEEQAGPSGVGAGERRLRSVVSVIRGRRAPDAASTSDSEDDLPLNLTVANSSSSNL